MTDFDSPWKEILDLYFPMFMAFFFPQAAAEIDWSRGYESLDKELQQVAPDAEIGRRVVDKLVRVWRTNGDEEWVLIHVEVQSQEVAEFTLRMYVYNYRLFDRYNKTVVSLAVLGDERANWRPTRFARGLWGCTDEFCFPSVKLLDYADRVAELEAHTNPFATVVLAHLKTQETRQDAQHRYAWKLRLIRGLYERGMSANDVRQLFRFIDWMMNLPDELEQQCQYEIHQYEQEKHMPYVTSIERFAIERGRKEGMQEGEHEGLLAGIAQCLKLRFGAESQQLLPEIRQITDLETLRTVLQAMDEVATLDELRQVWLRNSNNA